MNLSIREWRISDKSALARNLNNPKVLNNLRDGLPYPYTEQDAEDFITAMLSSDKDITQERFVLIVHGSVQLPTKIFDR